MPRSDAKALALLWLFGICLRLTVLAIPPVIPAIHASLRLTQTEVGALASLPVLLLSFAAVPGSFLIARLGARFVIIAGIVIAGLASALRGAAPDTVALFAATFAMGVGISILQPALPTIVREWVPERIALGTAVYSNGLLVGEALSASLTIPVVLPLVHGSWRWSLVAWSIPLFAIAALALVYRGHDAPHATTIPAGTRRRWWPDWRSALTWRLGLISGGCSSLYFASVAFLPDYLHAMGRPELTGPALSAMNWMQIPASMIMLGFARRLTLRRWPFFMLGVLSTIGVTGLITMHGAWVVMWAGLLGFCTAFILILSLALPPLLVEPHDVHRLSAAMFAISYLCALVTPVLGGFVWDVTGVEWAAFVPAGLFGPIVIALSIGLDLAHARARNLGTDPSQHDAKLRAPKFRTASGRGRRGSGS